MYGRRGRIGLLVPTGNTVMEPEFERMKPEGLSVHANRIYLEKVTPEALKGMESEAEAAASALVSCRLGVIAFGCTSGSFVGGKGYEAKLEAKISAATGLPAVTTSGAVLRALERLGVSRVALAAPYIDEVNAIEERWLKDNGIEVTASAGGGIVETADIQECEPGVAYERARAVDSPEAEAIFISCTGFRTLEIIERLEAELGKPVISANQATFADCLRHLGMHQVAPGCGSLFAHTFAAPQAPPAGRPAAE